MKVSKDEIISHDRVVVDVARREFRYPTPDHPNWRTVSNKPNPVVAIPLKPSPIFPDIVVMDEEKVIQMIGEIETEGMVNEEQMEK